MTSFAILTDLKVVLITGLTSGILDFSATGTLNRMRGIEPKRTLQGIASGILGPKSFEGGWSTAALGLGFHFLIAFSATAAYYLTSLKFSVLDEHAVLCGLLYGIAVHLFMTFVVVPLSRVRRPFTLWFFLAQFAIHMLFVGLPISLMIRHLA